MNTRSTATSPSVYNPSLHAQSVVDIRQFDLDLLPHLAEDLKENRIFSALCPNNEYSQAKLCYICDKKKKKLFGSQDLLNCEFCGKRVCKPCAEKKRKNPANREANTFHRICRVCESEYLLKMFIDEAFKEIRVAEDEMTVKKEEVVQREEVVHNLDLRIKISRSSRETKKGELEEREIRLDREVNELNEKVDKLEDEIMELKGEEKTTRINTNNILENITLSRVKVIDKGKESESLTEKVDALREEITDLEDRIKDKSIQLAALLPSSPRSIKKGRISLPVRSKTEIEINHKAEKGPKSCNPCTLI